MTSSLKVGDTVSITKAFSLDEVARYADIVGDHNPIHLDEDFAAGTIFGQRIVHGMLVASLFSGLIGEQLPGEGSIYLGQNVSFKAPVYIGEQVTATVEIVQIREDKPICTLSTICRNPEGKIVIKGEAVVLYS